MVGVFCFCSQLWWYVSKLSFWFQVPMFVFPCPFDFRFLFNVIYCCLWFVIPYSVMSGAKLYFVILMNSLWKVFDGSLGSYSFWLSFYLIHTVRMMGLIGHVYVGWEACAAILLCLRPRPRWLLPAVGSCCQLCPTILGCQPSDMYIWLVGLMKLLLVCYYCCISHRMIYLFLISHVRAQKQLCFSWCIIGKPIIHCQNLFFFVKKSFPSWNNVE